MKRARQFLARLTPKSLYGRLVLVLFGGLVLAQLFSAAINLAERDRLLARARGMQSAQRIAGIVELLDSLNPAERARIVHLLSVPPQRVRLSPAPLAEAAATGEGPMTAVFKAVLRSALGDQRPIRVAAGEGQRTLGPSPPEHRTMMRRHMGERRLASWWLIEVQLQDGSWVSFDTRLPPGQAGLPWRLIATLAMLLAAVLLLSFIAVRWLVRPLEVLARAADDLGRDIKRPPLPETGPVEVRRAAHAFNAMQQRLARFIDERSRLLAAMSHDLKTPITRMRLRSELLDDAELRQRYERDLAEMEAMVAQTLDFMRGLAGREPVQPIDLMALLESLQADYEEMGRQVAVSGRIGGPVAGMPRLLKRCIANLIDNALAYGKSAKIAVAEDAGLVSVRIRDEGPGLSPEDLQRVFQPFYRVEGSRSRETGGTGLGLAISRDIAQAHGGDVTLANHPEGGLEASLTLPRKP